MSGLLYQDRWGYGIDRTLVAPWRPCSYGYSPETAVIGENLIFLEELGNERHDMYGTRMDGVEARLAYCEHLMGHYSWLAAENKKTIEQLQAVASDNKRIIDQLQMNDARRKVDWVTRQQLDETRYKGGGHQRVEGRSG
ncbi:unnamed protein product, partial [Ascophyllum nodosum]